MVDPHNITNFSRTKAELEEFILNAAAFAGKNAVQQAQKMHRMLHGPEPVAGFHDGAKRSPFETIRLLGGRDAVAASLLREKVGKYTLLSQLFYDLAHSGIDLGSCPVDELVRFRGIGQKTARFFVLHSRPQQELVVLDTHVLKEMRRLGFTVPKGTPAGKKYIEIERQYIDHLRREGVTDFAQHDLVTWKRYTRSQPVGA